MRNAQGGARFLLENNWTPTVVISSPAQRAIETVETVIDVLDFSRSGLVIEPHLYLGSTESVVEVVSNFTSDDRMFIVATIPLLKISYVNASHYNGTRHAAWIPTACIGMICHEDKFSERLIVKMWRQKDDRYFENK